LIKWLTLVHKHNRPIKIGVREDLAVEVVVDVVVLVEEAVEVVEAEEPEERTNLKDGSQLPSSEDWYLKSLSRD
jgi:hypothetical protein